MIDFGDPNTLQLSSSFVEKEKIKVIKSDAAAKDSFGNTFEINQGIARDVAIGQWKSENLKFSSSPNEIESVSKQINTPFDAVAGWGYFNQYYIDMDYIANMFILSADKPANPRLIKLSDYELELDLQTQDLEILTQINTIGIIGGDFLEKFVLYIDPFKNEIKFVKH